MTYKTGFIAAPPEGYGAATTTKGSGVARYNAAQVRVAIAGGRVTVESLGAGLIVDAIYRNSSVA